MPQRRYRAGKKENRSKARSDTRFIRGKDYWTAARTLFPYLQKLNKVYISCKAFLCSGLQISRSICVGQEFFNHSASTHLITGGESVFFLFSERATLAELLLRFVSPPCFAFTAPWRYNSLVTLVRRWAFIWWFWHHVTYIEKELSLIMQTEWEYNREKCTFSSFTVWWHEAVGSTFDFSWHVWKILYLFLSRFKEPVSSFTCTLTFHSYLAYDKVPD